MPTTFASSINSNPIYAARAEADAAGNTISTTYATKAELPEGVPTVTSSDDGKVLQASYSGGTGSVSWVTPSSGTSYAAGDGIYINPTYHTISVDPDGALGGISVTSSGVGVKYDGTSINVNSNNEIQVVNPLPGSTSSDENKVLTVNSSGTPVWETPSAGGSRIVELTVGTSTWSDFTSAYAQLTAGTIDGIRAKASGSYSVYYADLVSVVKDLFTGTLVWAFFSAPAYTGGSNGTTGKRLYTIRYALDSTGNWTTSDVSTLASDIVAGAGISVSTDASYNIVVSASDPLPAHTSTESGKVLSVGATGDTEWVTPSGGTTYTAGNMVSLTNNAIAVSTTAGITDIQQVAALPANPVSTVLYLIPET